MGLYNFHAINQPQVFQGDFDDEEMRGCIIADDEDGAKELFAESHKGWTIDRLSLVTIVSGERKIFNIEQWMP
jgi:hypothetical protein